MKIKYVNIAKRFEQVFSHLTVDNAIDVGIVGYHRNYAAFIFLYKMLGVANEFYIIIRKRLYVLFIQPSFIVFDKILNPGAFIGRTDTVRRIADNNHNRFFVFYLGSFL